MGRAVGQLNVDLVERDGQLRDLFAALAGARSRHGNVVRVEGPAGVGKTVLLQAVQARAHDTGFRVLRASGGDLEGNVPFGVLRQLLTPLLAGRSQDQVFGAAAELVLEALTPRRGLAATSGAVALGFYWVCSNLGETGPLLVSIDDMHWCDGESLEVLTSLAGQIDDLPVLLLLAGRPATDDGPSVTTGRDVTLVVPPLTAGGVRSLVVEVLGERADLEFCAACAKTSAGNPFLLVEVLTKLRRDGIEPTAAMARFVAEVRPETVSRMFLGRLGRLHQSAPRFAQAVSVLGQDAILNVVNELAGLEEATGADVCDALVHDGLLEFGRPIRFAHPLVRSAVYEDSPPARRAVMHRRAAALLDQRGTGVDVVATHLLRSEPAGDSWAVEVLRAAADDALQRGAPQSAVAFLERVEAEGVPEVNVGQRAAARGHALVSAGRPVEAISWLTSAYESVKDIEQKVGVALELAQALPMVGRGGEAISLLGEMLAASDPASPTALRLEAARGFAGLGGLFPIEEWRHGITGWTPGLRGRISEERMVLSLASFASASTGSDSAAEVARVATLATPPSSADDGLLVVNFAGAALAIAGSFDAAMRMFAEGIVHARQRGDAFEYAYLSVMESHTSYYRGDLLEAEASARSAISLIEPGSPITQPALGVFLDVLVERGDLEEAQSTLTRFGLDDDVPMQILSDHFLHMGRGRLRCAQGRPGEALGGLIGCGERLDAVGYANPDFANWRSLAAEAAVLLGDRPMASAYAQEELELARRFGAPRAIGMAQRSLALASSVDDAVELLVAAIAGLEISGARLEHARAVVDYGALLRRTGRRGLAQDQLRTGLELATRCGATVLAARARGELIAAGARPRRDRTTGRESLTASELRVVLLAAEGHTNRGIAQRLFVSLRTVEVHLTHAYRKLQIESRGQLASAMTSGVTDADLV